MTRHADDITDAKQHFARGAGDDTRRHRGHHLASSPKDTLPFLRRDTRFYYRIATAFT